MAGSVVARAWVQILPEMAGIQSEISDELKGVDKQTSSAGKSSGSGFATAFKGAMGALAGAVSIAAIGDLVSQAAEAQSQMSRLSASAQQNGVSASNAQAAYSGLVGVLGDTDRAVETSGNLFALCGDNQAQLESLTTSLTGAFSQFGDGLPIESLAEAANETARTGTVVGGMADALNWVNASTDQWSAALGGNSKAQEAFNAAVDSGATKEDAFNAALAACSDEGERQQLVVDTLNALYGEAGAAYQDANADMIAYNQSQDALSSGLAAVGSALMPVVTGITNLAAQALGALAPAVSTIVGSLSGVGEAIGIVLDYATNWDSIAAEMSAEMGSVATAGDMVSLMLQEIGMAFGLMPEQTAPFRDAITGIVDAFVPLGAAFQNLWTVAQPLIAQLGTAFVGLFAALSPVIQSVASYFASWGTTLVNISTQVMSVLLPILTQVVNFVTTQIMPVVVPVIQQILATVQSAFPLIQAAITTALTVIQAIWNAVWPALQAVVMPIVQGISSFISGAMTAIQGVISVVLGIISGDWSSVWTGIQNIAQGVWDAISGIVEGAIGAVQGFIDGALSTIQSVWDSAWSSVKSFLSDTWEGIKSAASDGVSAVVDTVTGIKDRIVGFFSGAGQWLVDAGRSILEGLGEGISDAIGSVTGVVSGAVDAIRSFFPFSPAKRGPFSGHGYTTWSGKALMEDWGLGIQSETGAVVDYAAEASAKVRAALSATPTATGARQYIEDDATTGTTTNLYLDGSLVAVDSRIAQAVAALLGAVERRYDMGGVRV